MTQAADENRPEILLAKSAGFCFGVTRAIDSVHSLAEQYGAPIYTYGQLIHNAEAVRELEERGIKAVSFDEALKLPQGSRIVIRSHGITRIEQEALTAAGLDITDATCPFVKKIHNIVATETKKGKCAIIVGNANHPEVIGIRGWCEGDSYVVDDEEAAENLPQIADAIIVSQTTFNPEKFNKIVEKILQKCYIYSVVNTICSATRERQEEASNIACYVDFMIVIGDKQSSNSQKLFSICKSVCEKTLFVQTAADLMGVALSDAKRIGITAGASTPGNIIQEVLQLCQNKALKNY